MLAAGAVIGARSSCLSGDDVMGGGGVDVEVFNLRILPEIGFQDLQHMLVTLLGIAVGVFFAFQKLMARVCSGVESCSTPMTSTKPGCFCRMGRTSLGWKMIDPRAPLLDEPATQAGRVFA